MGDDVSVGTFGMKRKPDVQGGFVGEPAPDEYTRASTHIDPAQVPAEFVRIAADTAYWNTCYAKAYEVQLRAKLHEERTHARLWIASREVLLADGERTTEELIRAMVTSSPDWYAARLRTIEADIEVKNLRGVLEAVSAKREALISLGAHIREEMKGNPAIREESVSRHFTQDNNDGET